MASQAAEAESGSAPYGPIPDHILNPSYPDNRTKEHIEKQREVRQNLVFLQNIQDNPYAPYVWGFQIYRAVYGPGSDERFATALARFEAWVRWQLRQSRYEDDRIVRGQTPDCIPAVGGWDQTDEMAARFQNEVVEYPDMDDVQSLAPESAAGPEHFRCIGRAFIDWVTSIGVDPLSPVVRYNHCLVIDGVALRTLEELPAEVPEVKPGGKGREAMKEWSRVAQHMKSAWIWILDRDTMQRYLAGGTTPRMFMFISTGYEMIAPAPPWLHMQIYWVNSLWFRRSRAMMTLDWTTKCQWDGEDPDRILWWNPSAYIRNQSNYARGVRQTEQALRYYP